MGLLFISHDLSIVRAIADVTMVMYLGRIAEAGPTGRVWNAPVHPYSQALIEAIPRPDGTGRLPSELPGDVPDPARPPRGCRFHPRCPRAIDRCAEIEPARVAHAPGHDAACIVAEAARDAEGGSPPRPRAARAGESA
jgi:peptide/nickel transport system ATP-binding protein